MKAFKAFIKPFEAPRRSVEIKIQLNFSLRQGLGREGIIACTDQALLDLFYFYRFPNLGYL